MNVAGFLRDYSGYTRTLEWLCFSSLYLPVCLILRFGVHK